MCSSMRMLFNGRNNALSGFSIYAAGIALSFSLCVFSAAQVFHVRKLNISKNLFTGEK